MTELLGGIAIGFMLCVALVAVFLTYLYKKVEGGLIQDLEKQVKEEKAKLESKSIGVIVEREQGHYYFYNEKNNAFIGQGATVKEVRDIMRKRYPEATVYLSSASDEVTAMIKQELKELAKQ